MVALVAMVGLALIGGALAVVTLTRAHPKPAAPVASAYLADWTRQAFPSMSLLVDFPPSDFVAVHQGVVKDLDITSWKYQMGLVTTTGSTATAAFTAHLVLGGLGSWDYPGTLHLAKVIGNWKVEWTPSTIFHSLPVGGHFLLQRTWGPRAAVLGTGATMLAGPADVVTVGLQGNAISSPSLVTTALTQAGIAPAAITSALKAAAAHPTEFVPVTQMSDARYQQVKPIIFPVPGTRFQLQPGQTTATPDLAAHVVGSVGPITAEELSRLGAPYQATDSVGQGGIESQYERQLAGTPGGTIDVVGSDGTDLGTVDAIAGQAGVAVQTTLDLATEKAAETALNSEILPAAIVVLQASTGDILAAVSRPDTTAFDRSLQGEYPPGSTFKVVTSTALLTSGLTPASPATCPPTLTVDGRSFKNFEGEAALNLSFERAFEVSCNTAFIGMAGNLTNQELIAAAGHYGFGTALQPGLPVFGGQIPQPVDEVEKVADAIGQGRVLASPLEMAGVAAAVDSGAYHAPRLVAGAPDDSAAPVPLSQALDANLQTMMRAVVTGGTGTAANVSGAGLVYGKTGTAEFGNANPPMTHAWFIGFRGDIAFAIVVEGGGVGGVVAAPIAAKFLRALSAG
jgi:cell division protein FtsI/penicillin-binding protein 2